MCMSINHSTSFYDGRQEKIEIEYRPLGYPSPVLRVMCNPKPQPLEVCKCGGLIFHTHEHIAREVFSGTYQGVPIIYVMGQIRHLCYQCGATFVDRYDFLPEGGTITTDTENYIIWQLGTIPMSRIAESVGLSVQTIANRATAFGELEFESMLKGNYTFLSMDEVFIGRTSDGKHRIYWVLNDISIPWKANNIIIDTDRTKENVIKHLMSLKNKEKVVAVCTDMWTQYKEAISLVLPNAVIVVDRFHVIQLAEKRMDDVRKRSGCAKADKAAMKKDASLFLKSFFQLDNTELERLDGYLKLDPDLEKMYYILQDLLAFHNIRGYDEALEYLCKWESSVINSGVKEAVSLYETIYNWLPYIMNFFNYRITNGKTEGKNNLIRQIDRMGFHYGLATLRGCLYAHDRRQAYDKWKKYQKSCEKAEGGSDTPGIYETVTQSSGQTLDAA